MKMELYIETLTGAAFELRVSPFETILSVKAKIQRLEGIPISQQHLIWQSVELEDDYCLHDYSITDGATLKLVLAMRGGPINTRRIPREMEEYMEANREDWDRVSGRQVTLVVYRDGDQLNFFRLVPGDGTLSPLSESALSGASMYNLYDEEEEEEVAPKEKVEENEKTKEKMSLLRTKMESLTLNKKPKKKPHPPTSGRPSSKSKLRRIPSSGKVIPTSTILQYNKLNKNACLPPVGQSTTSADDHADLSEPSADKHTDLSELPVAAVLMSDVPATYGIASKNYLDSGESVNGTKLKRSLSSVKEDLSSSRPSSGHDGNDKKLVKRGTSKERCGQDEEEMDPLAKVLTSASSRRCEASSDSATGPGGSNASKKELTLEALKETLKLPISSSNKTGERASREMGLDHLTVPSSARKDFTFEALKETFGRPLTSSKFGTLDRKRGEITLESLSQAESRVMSGLLRQASIERLGSSKISSFVRSASKSRAGFTLGSAGIKEGRIPTPEGRLVSARLSRLSSSRDSRVVSPTHLLPPVKKKKAAKRCFVCGKKTGLATSYLCRCGKNFCLNHRYAESHDCSFDYKTEGRKLLEQSNPVVSAPKLPKI